MHPTTTSRSKTRERWYRFQKRMSRVRTDSPQYAAHHIMHYERFASQYPEWEKECREAIQDILRNHIDNIEDFQQHI